MSAGGYIAVSHPLGRRWHDQLYAGEPRLVPHALPDAAGLARLTAGLPLTVEAVVDEPELYLALLRVQQPANVFCDCPDALCLWTTRPK